MDKAYWWHNTAIIKPELSKFHYPFKPEFGDAPSYCFSFVKDWVGDRVLELGCGTGWLRESWHIKDYTGVERSSFCEPFESRLRAEARRNSVVNVSVEEFIDNTSDSFDTIICYESFHEFPETALDVIRSDLLESAGHAIIVDARSWWPSGLRLTDIQGLQLQFEHWIPDHFFDYMRIAEVSLDTFAALEEKGVPREEILECAESNMQPQLYYRLVAGMSVESVRSALPSLDLTPTDLDYVILVMRKLTRGNRHVVRESCRITPLSVAHLMKCGMTEDAP